jgi:hypothetical protein
MPTKGGRTTKGGRKRVRWLLVLFSICLCVVLAATCSVSSVPKRIWFPITLQFTRRSFVRVSFKAMVKKENARQVARLLIRPNFLRSTRKRQKKYSSSIGRVFQDSLQARWTDLLSKRNPHRFTGQFNFGAGCDSRRRTSTQLATTGSLDIASVP